MSFAGRRPSVVTGLCPPGPLGLAGDTGVDASHRGGIDPDFVTHAGLGRERRCLLLFLLWLLHHDVDGCWCPRHGCLGGGSRRRTTWVALWWAPWRWWWRLYPLVVWAVEGVAAGGSGTLSITVSCVTLIRTWGSELAVLVLKTSWWRRRAVKRK